MTSKSTPVTSVYPGIRGDLVGIAPYGAPQLDVPHLLNVNENPYQPSEAVIETIVNKVSQALTTANRYPDRDFIELRGKLASYLTQDTGVVLQSDQIWVANGSNEAMMHIFQAFGGPGRRALSFSPTYSMYPEYARESHTQWLTQARDSDFTLRAETVTSAIKEHAPAITVITSPNNPTGTAVGLDVVESALQAAASLSERLGFEALVVVDEAYGEFRRDGVSSAIELLSKYRNLIVTRTMSKAFAMAGLRLGYLAADPSIVNALQIVRLPYHLSTVTQASALAALEHSAELLQKVAELRIIRDETISWLKTVPYGEGTIETAESDANFIYFGTFPDRDKVWQDLLNAGVLIRATGPNGWLRVSIGTRADMQAFKNALLNSLGVQEN